MWKTLKTQITAQYLHILGGFARTCSRNSFEFFKKTVKNCKNVQQKQKSCKE